MANWNNQTATGAEKGVGWLSGFRAFILRGNVVGLALGIVIGAAFIAIVNAFVSDVITPLIPVSNSNFADWTVPLPYGHSILKIGAFMNAVISFLIVAFIFYFFVVRPVNALMATRCAYCTSPLPPPNIPTQPPTAPQQAVQRTQ